MWVPWWVGLLAALALASARFGGRRRWPPAVAAPLGEAALVLSLYALWRLGEEINGLAVTGARARGLSVFDLQRSLHLPDERMLQRLVLPHPWLAQLANGYYALAHVPAVIVLLLWAFFFHRDRYPAVRTSLAFVTATSLLLHLVPVAPPRFFPELGFVDTAARYHQSVYGPVGTGLSDQVAAMPSVHVAWAVLVGAAAVLASSSRWRWLVLLHPALTIWAVTVTANHWWLDGVVAVVLLGLGWLAHAAGLAVGVTLRRRLATLRPTGRPTPAGLR